MMHSSLPIATAAARAALALLVTASAAVAESGRHIYWVDANATADEIYRINEDDSTTPLGIASVASDVNDGLAFDRRSGSLYWMSGNPDALFRTVVSGTDVFEHESFGPPLLSSANPQAIAVDRYRGFVYWLETGRDSESPPILGSVRRRDTDASGQVVVAPDLLGPRGLVSDPRGGTQYWGQKVLPVQTIWKTGPGGSTEIVSSAGVVWDVDYDHTTDRVYWTSTQGSGPGIYMHAADGSGGPLLFARRDLGDTSPHGLFIDAEARRLYWTDRSPTAPGIFVVDLDATPPVVVTTPDYALADGALPGDILVERLDRNPPQRVPSVSAAPTPAGVRLHWAPAPDTSAVVTTIVRWSPGFVPPSSPYEGSPAVLFVDDGIEVLHPTSENVISYSLFFEDEDGNLSVLNPHRSTATVTRGIPDDGETATVYWMGLAETGAESNFLGATRIGRGYTDVLAQDLSSAQRLAWDPLTRLAYLTLRGDDEIRSFDPATGDQQILYDWCGAKGVAIDPFRKRVYWGGRGGGSQCDAGDPGDPIFRGVFYGHLDGMDAGHSPISVVDSTENQANDVALDLWRNRVFWCSAAGAGGQITSIDLDTLDDPVPTMQTLTVAEEVEAIDIDPISGHLFWTERDASNRGTIFKIDITGDWTSNTPEACFLTQAETEGVAYDPVGDRLFFADRDFKRVNVQTCGDVSQKTVFSTDGELPWDVAVRQDDQTPPADPFDVTARSGGNGVAIAWSLPSDAVASVVRWQEGSIAPASYDEGDDLAFFTTTESVVNHGDLTTGQDYSYRISAIDAAGNVSSGSTVTVTVIAEDAVGFELSDTTLDLAVGMSVDVTATLLLEGGGSTDVTGLALWSSSQEGVVSAEPGRIHVLSAGQATITVDYFGFSETLQVRAADVAEATTAMEGGSVVLRLPNPDVGTASVTGASIAFRLGGDQDLGGFGAMTRDGSDWTVDLFASIRGFEYVARLALDDGGTLQVGTLSAPRRASVTTTMSVPSNGDVNYHMVSFPAVGIDDDDVVAALETRFGGASSDSTWFLHRWINDDYELLDGTVEFDAGPGHAFWLAARDFAPWTLTGSTSWPAESGFFEVTLPPTDWTMVGNPAAYHLVVDPLAMLIRDGTSDPVVFSDAGSLVDQSVYQRVGDAYVTRDLLPPFSGCWVYNQVARPLTLLLRPEDGQIIRERSRSTIVASGADPASVSWPLLVRVSARDGDARREVLLGRAPRAHDGWDPLDRAAAPPAPGQSIHLWVDRPEAPPEITLPARYRQNVAGATPTEVVWTISLSTPSTTSLSLTIDGSELDRYSVTLREETSGLEWDLATLRSLDVAAGEHRFTIRSRPGVGPGTTSPAAGVWLLARPNPVSTSTQFHYRVPVDGSASLDVYSVVGRRVWSSGTRRVDGGEHAIGWDLTTPAGHAATPGVYFVRLEFVSGDAAMRFAAREKLTITSR